MKRTLKLLAVGLIGVTQVSVASACPMCKYALESNDAEPTAYMISILFMMGMISLLFALVAGLLVWISRMEKKNLKAAGYQHVLENAGSQPFAQVEAKV